MEFNYKWDNGKRVPDSVEFPDGTIKDVQYMRDGLCLFVGGDSTSYERTTDNSATFIIVETFEQAMEEALAYRNRVGFND